MKPKIILMLMLVLMLAACAKLVKPGSSVSPIGTPRPTRSSTSPLPTPFQSPLATPFESPLATPDMSGQAALVQLAINDLANRFGLNTDKIAVLSVSQVELPIPDAACPADNANSPSPVTPGQTIGWEIILTANQMTFTYHLHGREMVLCPSLP